MAWDATLPADNEAISQGASRIRTLKSDLATALSTEGTFPGPDTANPKFYVKLNAGTTAARPAASANYPGRPYVNTTTGSLQRVKDDGSAWEDVMLSPSSAAIHAAVAASLASVAGVVTLPETGNAFNVTGTEAVTSIAGWSAGIVIIKWSSARNITHSSTLVLRQAVDRLVVADDVSIFQFSAAATCREIGFYGAGMGKLVGESIMWNSETVPAGFLEENGASLLRADYPGLFAVIGTAHGAADASHFNLPVSTGRFPRGWDHGAGTDPDAASRTAAASGGATGDHVGTLQADGNLAHTHSTSGTQGNTVNADGASSGFCNSFTSTTSTSSGGNEARPKNVAKMFIIKY